MIDCLFCKIAAGDIPANVVHQDAEFVAFKDIDPQAPVHVLVIPRLHLPRVSEASGEHAGMLGRWMLVAAEVATRQGVAESGYRLVINNGVGANQTVPHVHMHVLGGRALRWPPG